MPNGTSGLRLNLVLGDAYLEAALGLDDSDRTTRFEKQFASAAGFTLSRRVPPRFMLELTGASSGDMRLSDHAARSMI